MSPLHGDARRAYMRNWIARRTIEDRARAIALLGGTCHICHLPPENETQTQTQTHVHAHTLGIARGRTFTKIGRVTIARIFSAEEHHTLDEFREMYPLICIACHLATRFPAFSPLPITDAERQHTRIRNKAMRQAMRNAGLRYISKRDRTTIRACAVCGATPPQRLLFNIIDCEVQCNLHRPYFEPDAAAIEHMEMIGLGHYAEGIDPRYQQEIDQEEFEFDNLD